MNAIYFRCRNWHRFQHYQAGGRRLSWIKNYIDLDDPSNPFSKLSFAEQGRLQALWRLAAKLDNKIPYDEAYVARAIGAKRMPLGVLLASKWIQVGTETELKRLENAEKKAANRKKPASKALAKRYQKASLEEEVEEETPTPFSGKSEEASVTLRESWALFVAGQGWDETFTSEMALEELGRIERRGRTTGSLSAADALALWWAERARRYPDALRVVEGAA